MLQQNSLKYLLPLSRRLLYQMSLSHHPSRAAAIPASHPIDAQQNSRKMAHSALWEGGNELREAEGDVKRGG
jgi:hypothetical protein